MNDTPTPALDEPEFAEPDTGYILLLEHIYAEPSDSGNSLTPPPPPRPPAAPRRFGSGPNDRMWRNLLLLIFALFAFTVGALLGEGMNAILRRGEE
jgi:hypothetical protein